MLLLSVPVLAASGCASSPERDASVALPVAEAESILRSANYHIGPADLLEITVFEAEELTRTVRVSEEGEVSLPLVGSVTAAGLTPGELEGAIEDHLRGRYMVDPHVTVQVTELRSRSIYVLGEVERPGAFPLTSNQPVTVLQALALGEGLTSTAARDRALIIRADATGQRAEIPVDIERVVAGEAPDPQLRPNDIVFVPNSTAKSLALGLGEALVRMVTLGRIIN